MIRNIDEAYAEEQNSWVVVSREKANSSSASYKQNFQLLTVDAYDVVLLDIKTGLLTARLPVSSLVSISHRKEMVEDNCVTWIRLGFTTFDEFTGLPDHVQVSECDRKKLAKYTLVFTSLINSDWASIVSSISTHPRAQEIERPTFSALKVLARFDLSSEKRIKMQKISVFDRTSCSRQGEIAKYEHPREELVFSMSHNNLLLARQIPESSDLEVLLKENYDDIIRVHWSNAKSGILMFKDRHIICFVCENQNDAVELFSLIIGRIAYYRNPDLRYQSIYFYKSINLSSYCGVDENQTQLFEGVNNIPSPILVGGRKAKVQAPRVIEVNVTPIKVNERKLKKGEDHYKSNDRRAMEEGYDLDVSEENHSSKTSGSHAAYNNEEEFSNYYESKSVDSGDDASEQPSKQISKDDKKSRDAKGDAEFIVNQDISKGVTGKKMKESSEQRMHSNRNSSPHNRFKGKKKASEIRPQNINYQNVNKVDKHGKAPTGCFPWFRKRKGTKKK